MLLTIELARCLDQCERSDRPPEAGKKLGGKTASSR